jgi:hypothetical protein
MHPTPNPRSVGLDKHSGGARIEATPASPARPLVIARRPATTPATPTLRPGVWTRRDHNRIDRFVETYSLNNGARQPTRTSPYTVVLHRVLLPLVPSL